MAQVRVVLDDGAERHLGAEVLLEERLQLKAHSRSRPLAASTVCLDHLDLLALVDRSFLRLLLLLQLIFQSPLLDLLVQQIALVHQNGRHHPPAEFNRLVHRVRRLLGCLRGLRQLLLWAATPTMPLLLAFLVGLAQLLLLH